MFESSAGRRIVATCGLLGVALLVGYFLGPWPLPAATASDAQIAAAGQGLSTGAHVASWLQLTGTALAVVFLIGISEGEGPRQLCRRLVVAGCGALLAVVTIESLATITWAAAAESHPATSVVGFVLMGYFQDVIPIGPAPLIYVCLGLSLLRSRALPRPWAALSIALAAGFEISGLVTAFTPVGGLLTLVVVIGQAVWIASAAVVVLTRRGDLAMRLAQP